MDRGWHTCPHPGCPQLTRGGACPDHANRPEHAATYDHQWRTLAALYLTTHRRCVRCGAPATEVDHITPVRMGGARLDPRNWRALCHRCHVKITVTTRATPSRTRRRP